MVEEVKQTWSEAALSGRGSPALASYFNHQLRSLAVSTAQTGVVLELTDHLLLFYGDLAGDATAHPAFAEREMKHAAQRIDILEQQWAAGAIDPAFAEMLKSYCRDLLDPRVSPNIGSFMYARRLLGALLTLPAGGKRAERSLTEIFIFYNFNYLGCFLLLKSRHGSMDCDLAGMPEHQTASCCPGWPSLKTMITGWMTEQALSRPRFPLNLPVPHLALLLRLFQEESVFHGANMTAVFQAASAAFSSKRTSKISPGSLSKEYYSTSQQTAARVRDLLERMIRRTDRLFFPCLLAVSQVLPWLAKIH